jgi:hypothetical protein
MSKKRNATPQAKPAPKGRSMAEFRAAHDKSFIVPTKIKTALETIGEGWAYEGEFVKLAGISATELGVYRGQFEEFIVTLKGTEHGGRRAWAGTKALAAKLRAMVS